MQKTLTDQSPSHSPAASAVAGGIFPVQVGMFADEARALALFLDRIAFHSVMEVQPEGDAQRVLSVAIRMRGFL